MTGFILSQSLLVEAPGSTGFFDPHLPTNSISILLLYSTTSVLSLFILLCPPPFTLHLPSRLSASTSALPCSVISPEIRERKAKGYCLNQPVHLSFSSHSFFVIMCCKACFGRWSMMLFSIAFAGGVLMSTLSPMWIETIKEDPAFADTDVTSLTTLEYQFGPFYSRNRTCDPRNGCDDWNQHGVSTEDCNWVVNETSLALEDNSMDQKLCRHNTTWRVFAMFCIFIVIITGGLIFVACCIQGFTCGCCGGSINVIVSILCWIEVLFSILAWSFAISTVVLLRDLDDTDSADFLWGFWIFLLSGTILGGVCAVLSDWAAEGSILKCALNCFKCVVCCGKR